MVNKTFLLAVLAAVTLGLAGCGDVPPDPGASRAEAQSEQLRDRLRNGQMDR